MRHPSGTGIKRSSNEKRRSSESPQPTNPSFSTHRAKQLRPVSHWTYPLVVSKMANRPLWVARSIYSTQMSTRIR